MKVDDNCMVKVNYSIQLNDGQMVEKNPDGEPLEFVTGRDQVVPCLEDGIKGMEPGQRRSFQVEPEQAFGHRDPAAVEVVNRRELDEREIDLEPGMILRLRDEEDNLIVATVISVDDEEVVFDFNHPLAGARLLFEVEVLDVGEAPPP